MVGWQRHLQSLLRNSGRRFECSEIAPGSAYHTKASTVFGEIACAKPPSYPLSTCTRPLYQYLQQLGFTSSRTLRAEFSNETPISSPLTPTLAIGSGKVEPEKAVSKPEKVQAVLKGIKQSPKKVNLVAEFVRGMRVEDALLQLQVVVKRACKTVYQVIHSAKANAAHNHGLDPDRLIVAEAFVGKGFFKKRLSYHAKGKCGVRVKPECRLTVVLREMTPEEEAKIARLRVNNYRKLSKKEKRLVPHELIESTPVWNRRPKSMERTPVWDRRHKSRANGSDSRAA